MTSEARQSGNGRAALAREYEAIHNRLFLLQVLVLAILLVLYQFSGASMALANGLANRFGDGLWFATNAAYTAVSVFGFAACMFPFSYYSGYVLEHHYGLSRETFGDWFADFAKSLLIDLVLATILFSAVYALLRWMPVYWWVAAAVFYILFGVLVSTLFPVVIMPLFHKFEPLEEGELTESVRRMMAEEGIRVLGVFKWGLAEKTATANAAFVGLGRTKRIVLGDTLLSGYSREEILAILAHEVGHYRHHDTARLVVVSSVFAVFGFFMAHLCLGLLVDFYQWGRIDHIGTAPAFIFSLFVFSLASMPFANMYSRHREFAADAYAVARTGSPEPLVSALEKLADQNLTNKEPAEWVEFLLHSHPSIAKRIRRVRGG